MPRLSQSLVAVVQARRARHNQLRINGEDVLPHQMQKGGLDHGQIFGIKEDHLALKALEDIIGRVLG